MGNKFCLLLFTLFHIVLISAGQGDRKEKPVNKDVAKTGEIRLRCEAAVRGNSPLYVVDGKVADSSVLNSIDPASIASIDVLKITVASALFGSQACNGAIIITTKKANETTLTVHDILSGNAIPGATIRVINSEKNDTMNFVADEEGRIVTGEIRSGVEYSIEASCIGYKEYTSILKKNTGRLEQEIKLSPKVKSLEDVVLYTTDTRTIHCGSIRCISVISQTDAEDKNNLLPGIKKVYPNPVSRSQSLKINYDPGSGQQFSLRLSGTDGRIVYTQQYNTSKGLSLFEIPMNRQWAAGMYVLSVFTKEGKLVQSQPVVVN